MRHIDTSSPISVNAIASYSQTSYSQASQPQTDIGTQTAVTPHYVWVTEPTLLTSSGHPLGHPSNYQPGDKVGDRYWVISSYIWQDTQPFAPCNPGGYPLSDSVRSYLRLQSYSLHLPTLYGVFFLSQPLQDGDQADVHRPMTLLLDNVPIDDTGQLLPAIQSCWSTASPVRQLHWLWQLLELWQVLSRWDQTASLLAPQNIRIDGWRIRLVNVWDNAQWRQLEGVAAPFTEGQGFTHFNTAHLNGFKVIEQPPHWYLAQLWQTWVDQGHPSLVEPLTQLCTQLKQPTLSWNRIKQELNILLLQHSAQQPLRMAIAGGSRGISDPSHTAPPPDICYPNQRFNPAPFIADSSITDPLTQTAQDNNRAKIQDDSVPYDVSTGFVAPQPRQELDPYVAILCDGVNDLARGVIASQLVTRSLKLQLGALLTEIQSHQTSSDLIPAEVLSDQLGAIVRIVNNVLLAQNHSHPSFQSSLSKVEMTQASTSIGTTATLAVQIPQAITTPQGRCNSHELYIASVGNSRAYWLTPTHCHRLTHDDNVAARNVLGQLGRGRLPQRELGKNSHDSSESIPSQLQHQGLSYHDAQLQSGSTRLTQALGLKKGDTLTIQVRRLIVDEDGLLLLCSHSLGDRVETHWQSLTTRILQNEVSLNDGIEAWLNLLSPLSQDDLRHQPQSGARSTPSPGKEKPLATNAHPYISVVMMHCQISDPPALLLPNPFTPLESNRTGNNQMATEMALNNHKTEEDQTRALGPSLSAPDVAIKNVAIKNVAIDPESPRFHFLRAFRWWSLFGKIKLSPGSSNAPESEEVDAPSELDPNPFEPLTSSANAESEDEKVPSNPPVSWHWIQLILGCMAVMAGAIALGLAAWRYIDPVLFDRVIVRSTEEFIERVQNRYPLPSERTEE